MFHLIIRRAFPERAQEPWLLGYRLELGISEPGGEAIEHAHVEAEEAWLAGVGAGARQERLVPTAMHVFVHGVGVRWRPKEHNKGLIPRTRKFSGMWMEACRTVVHVGIHGCSGEEDGKESC